MGGLKKFMEIVGVYDAEGSLWGEFKYFLGKARGTRACALCDITHAGLRKKSSFRQLQSCSQIPLRMVHLDERTDAERAASEGRTPCVIGRHAEGWEVLLTKERLEECLKSVELLEKALRPFL